VQPRHISVSTHSIDNTNASKNNNHHQCNSLYVVIFVEMEYQVYMWTVPGIQYGDISVIIVAKNLDEAKNLIETKKYNDTTTTSGPGDPITHEDIVKCVNDTEPSIAALNGFALVTGYVE
jgi:hypothetical protein